jgi:hypothetical protein
MFCHTKTTIFFISVQSHKFTETVCVSFHYLICTPQIRRQGVNSEDEYSNTSKQVVRSP